MLLEMKEAFESQEQEQADAEQRKAKKEAEKSAWDALLSAQISQDAVSKTFDSPFSSYKQKADLMTIAGAFGLNMSGTNAHLTEWIKEHMGSNPGLTDNPQFTTLYRHKSAKTSSHTLLFKSQYSHINFEINQDASSSSQ